VREPDHQHHWSQRRRRDHCHYVSIERDCLDCGETVVDDIEDRDFEDFNEIVFAREDCASCRQKLTGREPASWTKGEPHAQPSG
jgi:hypothetical protein